MDNKIEVLNRLLHEVNRKLKLANESTEKLKVEREIDFQALRKLYDYEDKLEKRRTVLQEIIEDENLKSGVIKENTNDDIIVGADMGKGADTTVFVRDISRETAEELIKRMERNHKHGKV
ncbi:hypothetical protein [Proteiniclasticum ruminis]|uniref:Uncharacterized protein n=1 Tax=Proteiniclasticum ruminis TaxID=398199 RepID=A0A1I4ZLV6_9CLOT|nr:hypothetical protein [Proteiniclasticum ruminis]SFN50949.1 hypothetical protein SAMN04488695_10240 [Proteiniclasticum ruminis]